MTRKSVALAIQALRWLAVVEWRRRRVPFGELLRTIEGGPVGPTSSAPVAAVLAIVHRVCCLLPVRVSCLRESLASVGLLRSLGYPARIAIGVRSIEDPIEAHAWVLLDGAPVGVMSGQDHAMTRTGD